MVYLKRNGRSASPSSVHSKPRLPIVIWLRQGRLTSFQLVRKRPRARSNN